MKVYAVIERCEDNYYPDYMVVYDCVYLREEDAEKRRNELIKEDSYMLDYLDIREFEVKE